MQYLGEKKSHAKRLVIGGSTAALLGSIVLVARSFSPSYLDSILTDFQVPQRYKANIEASLGAIRRVATQSENCNVYDDTKAIIGAAEASPDLAKAVSRAYEIISKNMKPIEMSAAPGMLAETCPADPMFDMINDANLGKLSSTQVARITAAFPGLMKTYLGELWQGYDLPSITEQLSTAMRKALQREETTEQNNNKTAALKTR
jgi:hypothetical protein